MSDEEIENKVLHIHKNREKENPEIYRVLTVTGLNHTVDIRTTFEDEDFEHLIGIYEKILKKNKEIEKNE